MAEKNIYIYDSFSFENPCLLGILYINYARGQETYSFEYDKDWLRKTNYSISIDPDLPTYEGRIHSLSNGIFGVFQDASPDRWGRLLLKKKELILAKKDNRKPQKLNESDYLLGVYDETRMGGLRFKLELDGQFLNDDKEYSTPPWTTLRTLEELSRKYEEDDLSLDHKWINQLIKPGSSLGGARPKASVVDTNNNLWIAKFPSKNDDYDTGAWEMVAHDLAKLCGLNVPEAKLEKFSDLGSTYLVKRFDRRGSKRIHLASAMTLLNKKDGASASDGSSYLELVNFIRVNSINPKEDLIELYKRIIFFCAITNSDDHLRNHAFLLEKNHWKLSPLYDVNPTPYGNTLSLNIDNQDNTIDLDLVLSVANYFLIDKKNAETYIKEILAIVKGNYEKLARKYGLTNREIEYMRPAFNNCEGTIL